MRPAQSDFRTGEIADQNKVAADQAAMAKAQETLRVSEHAAERAPAAPDAVNQVNLSREQETRLRLGQTRTDYDDGFTALVDGNEADAAAALRGATKGGLTRAVSLERYLQILATAGRASGPAAVISVAVFGDQNIGPFQDVVPMEQGKRFVKAKDEMYGQEQQLDANGEWKTTRTMVKLYQDPMRNTLVVLSDKDLRDGPFAKTAAPSPQQAIPGFASPENPATTRIPGYKPADGQANTRIPGFAPPANQSDTRIPGKQADEQSGPIIEVFPAPRPITIEDLTFLSSGNSNGSDGKSQQTFHTLEDFNRAANSPQPDSRYTYGNYSWETDSSGRVSTVQGQIALSPHGRVTTDGVSTTVIGNSADAQPGDVGFHLIGDQFDGPINRVNVVPGNGVSLQGLKALNLSEYKIWENQVARLAANPANVVEVKIEARYNQGNATTRPDAFLASYRVNGGEWSKAVFRNKAGG